MRITALLALVLVTTAGCYNWNRVPDGAEQRTLDLPVDGLTQRYTVLSPKPSATAPALKHPALVLLHSGFTGDEKVSAELARRFVQRGLVVILPAYRGEKRRVDGKRSEGKIEFCRGEVNDAQAALQWLRAQPTVDAQRLAALGSSHGGCIALELGQREPALRALVTFSAPVAAESLINHLQGHPEQTFFYNGILAAQLKSYMKASPAAPAAPTASPAVPTAPTAATEQAAKYEERSPLSGIERISTPMLVFHGTEDHIVPLEQACWLYQVLATSGRHIEERWIDTKGTLHAPAKSACPQAAAVHPATPLPTRTEFIFLEEQGHFYASEPRHTATETAVNFLMDELKP